MHLCIPQGRWGCRCTHLQAVCDELQWRAGQGLAPVLDWDVLSSDSRVSSICAPETLLHPESKQNLIWSGGYRFGRRISDRGTCVTRLCNWYAVPFTLIPHSQLLYRILFEYVEPAVYPSTLQIYQHCDFYFASTRRFVDPSTGAKSSMQLGVTVNGEGCCVAGRLRREAIAALPKEVGGAVMCIGQLRRFARERWMQRD
ncbi:hypothetical protein BKA83DRAFT_2216957 [Pisolithus microcarpus]|nr:hypothetical protein BKA83DRAFT_2216957 [Pisolithus microcarpus]